MVTVSRGDSTYEIYTFKSRTEINLYQRDKDGFMVFDRTIILDKSEYRHSSP